MEDPPFSIAPQGNFMTKEQRYELKYGRINPLTGLPDRQKLLNAVLSSKSTKLALININGFWNINVTLGRFLGDEFLQTFAKRLERRLSHASLFHLGGDLFAVLGGKDWEEERFIKSLQACIWYFGYSPIELEGKRFYAAIRIGLAMGEGENVFNEAEFALREAKKSHRDLVIRSSSSPSLVHEEILEYVQLSLSKENQIREAIKKDRFEVYAQKIAGSKRPKYECLIRMRQNDGKILSPYFFLEDAKKANLYSHLTKGVVKKSCAFFADKEADFSINLTASDILDQSTAEFIIACMHEYSVAEKLILELVESEGIENEKEISNFLLFMKNQGVRIAIDDFGTGYSNFEYLLRLQADFIKIDGSIVKNIHTSPLHRAVAESIISFAQKMQIKTVAEFVSSKTIHEACKELGFDEFQGYFWGEPMALKNIK